jgi:hypothetical protein
MLPRIGDTSRVSALAQTGEPAQAIKGARDADERGRCEGLSSVGKSRCPASACPTTRPVETRRSHRKPSGIDRATDFTARPISSANAAGFAADFGHPSAHAAIGAAQA